MASSTKKNLLDLTTGHDRPTVTIDGKPFDMRDAGEFSLSELRRIQNFGTRFQSAFDPDKGDDESIDAETVKVLSSILPDAPGELLAKLPALHVVQLIKVFLEASAPAIRAVTGSKKTSESSSPDSSASTEQAPPSSG